MGRNLLTGLRKVGQAVNWKDEIAEVAGPVLPEDNQKSWLDRAARRAGVSFRTISALWYEEMRDPKWSVGAQILEAKAKVKQQEAREEAQRIASRYEQIAERLVSSDEDFHSPTVAALISAARVLRDLDSAGD